MNLPGKIKPAVAAVLLLTGSAAVAGEGGGVLVREDGSVVLADPYRITNGELLHPFSKELMVASHLLVQFGAPTSFVGGTFMSIEKFSGRYNLSEFIHDRVIGSRVEYLMVDRLPEIAECTEAHPSPELRSGAEGRYELAACTQGFVTWIRKDYYEKLSRLDRMALLIHEAAHRLPGPIPHRWIEEFTTSIRFATELFLKQMQGERPELSQEEIGLLTRLQKRMVSLGLVNQAGTSYKVMRRGGALVHPSASRVSDEAYLGVGLVLSASSRIDPRAEATNTYCFGATRECDLVLGERSISKNAHFVNLDGQVELGRGSLIEGAVFVSYGPGRPVGGQDVSLGAGAKISRVLQSGYIGRLMLGSGALLENIRLDSMNSYMIGGSASYWPAGIELEEDAALVNVEQGGVHGPLSANLGQVSMLVLEKGTRLDFLGAGLPCQHVPVFGIERVDSAGELSALCASYSF